MTNTTSTTPVALITGSARRLGAETARQLHAAGYQVLLHYRHSAREAEQLAASLNSQRANSAHTLQAELTRVSDVQSLAARALAKWQRLDVLVNNASSFYPTPLASASESQWDDLLASNVKAPFFLAQALAAPLRQSGGCIINIADIYGQRPLAQHSIYSIAKAGNIMLTQALALELAPEVRVNGIAPGAILWPEQTSNSEASAAHQAQLLAKTPLARAGNPADIARTIVFLAQGAPYISGQIIAVDGGRQLTI